MSSWYCINILRHLFRRLLFSLMPYVIFHYKIIKNFQIFKRLINKLQMYHKSLKIIRFVAKLHERRCNFGIICMEDPNFFFLRQGRIECFFLLCPPIGLWISKQNPPTPPYIFAWLSTMYPAIHFTTFVYNKTQIHPLQSRIVICEIISW